jgi:hypothetical protein
VNDLGMSCSSIEEMKKRYAKTLTRYDDE